MTDDVDTTPEAERAPHSCTMPPRAVMAGKWCEAITYCASDEVGRFYVGNGEYASYVNHCPFCGEKAPLGIPERS